MSVWPFYFALIILVLLVNIRLKEPITDGDAVNNIQKSINYGDSSFNKENEVMTNKITELMKERDVIINKDLELRPYIDSCMGDLTKQNEVYTILQQNYTQCGIDLQTETGLAQGCLDTLYSTNSQVTKNNIMIDTLQKTLENCNNIIKNGPVPEDPSIKKAKDIEDAARKTLEAQQAAAKKAAETQNVPQTIPVIDYYTGKLNQCNVDVQNAERERERRRYVPPQPSGCVIL
jgi:uncharacterized coiled-coil DUF342 family protein